LIGYSGVIGDYLKRSRKWNIPGIGNVKEFIATIVGGNKKKRHSWKTD